MACKSCDSDNQRKLASEIAVHFPGLRNIGKPHYMVFPELLVCLDCGMVGFVVSGTELTVLGEDADTRVNVS